MTLIAGVYLPAGVGVEPEPVFIDTDNTANAIQQHVGGWFDVVRLPIRAQDGNTGTLLGYVHDEGMILDMDYNYLATALFKRQLHGGCVVLWGNNPQTGEYDGEVYDLPAELYPQLFTKLVEFTANVYNEAAIMEQAFQYAVDNEVVSQNDYDLLLDAMMRCNMDGGRLTGEAKAIYDKVMYYLATEIADNIASERADDDDNA